MAFSIYVANIKPPIFKEVFSWITPYIYTYLAVYWIDSCFCVMQDLIEESINMTSFAKDSKAHERLCHSALRHALEVLHSTNLDNCSKELSNSYEQ